MGARGGKFCGQVRVHRAHIIFGDSSSATGPASASKLDLQSKSCFQGRRRCIFDNLVCLKTSEEQYLSDAVAGQFEHQHVEKRKLANGQQWFRDIRSDSPQAGPTAAAEDSSLADHLSAPSFNMCLVQSLVLAELRYSRTSPDE